MNCTALSSVTRLSCDQYSTAMSALLTMVYYSIRSSVRGFGGGVGVGLVVFA